MKKYIFTSLLLLQLTATCLENQNCVQKEVLAAARILVTLKTSSRTNPTATKPKPLVCSECNKEFKHLSRLQTHSYTHFPERKPFLCPWPKCTSRFTDNTHLIYHTYTHKKASNACQRLS